MLGEDRQFGDLRGGPPDGRSASSDRFDRHPRSWGWLALFPKLALSASALVLSVTGSFIAWEYFGRPEPAPVPVVNTAQVPAPDWTGASLRLATLETETQALRAELDGLVGPGGVLPRIIERLREEKRVEAVHRAAIDQLFQLMARSDVVSAGGAQGLAFENGAPVTSTPVRAAEMDRPVRVIVTPRTETPAPEVRDE